MCGLEVHATSNNFSQRRRKSRVNTLVVDGGCFRLHLPIKGAQILVVPCMLLDVAMAVVLDPHSTEMGENLQLAHRYGNSLF